MKDKDIESRLKAELDTITPDVYSRAKIAPINRLLTGETPTQAFKKELTTWILVFTLFILLVLSVSVCAYVLNPEKESASYYYVGITVENGEDVQKIGIIADNTGSVLGAMDENSKAVISSANGKALDEAIATLLTPKAGDELIISTQNDMLLAARNQSDAMLSRANELYGSVDHSVQCYVCINSDIFALTKFLDDNEDANANMSVDELAKLYLAYLRSNG